LIPFSWGYAADFLSLSEIPVAGGFGFVLIFFPSLLFYILAVNGLGPFYRRNSSSPPGVSASLILFFLFIRIVFDLSPPDSFLLARQAPFATPLLRFEHA